MLAMELALLPLGGFWLDRQFGTTYAVSVLADHVLSALGGRTAAQAIEDGEDPRDVWRALCADFDVPRERW